MFKSSNTLVRLFDGDAGCTKRETRLILLQHMRKHFRLREVIFVIGDVLKHMRKIYGYKAVEMSKELGISTSYLSEIENGKKQPSLEHLKKYAQLFGIKLSSLILLSESYEEAEKSGKGTALIRSMMISLINSMSKSVEDKNEASEA